MQTVHRTPELASRIHHRVQLLQRYPSDHRIASAVRAGELVRVSRGWYASAEFWRGLYAEDRHLLRVIAASRSAHEPPIFSHISAAAIWRLPLYRLETQQVHVTVPRHPRINSTPTVKRHTHELPSGSVTELHGLRCTTLQRTVIDLARSASAEIALTAADAALRQLTSSHSRTPSGEEARSRCLKELADLPSAHGHLRAREILMRADARSESPLESVSRLHFMRMGFRFALQIPVPSPNGGTYRVDLELLDEGILVEIDGRAKYRPAAERELSAERTLYEEKRRQDWIVSTTGKRLVRLSASEITSTRTLARCLRAYGITIPQPPL